MDQEAAQKKARDLVLRLLTYRARSKKEVAEYLGKKGFDGDIIDSIIKEIEGYGYIDDEKFAADYINYRKMRGYGFKRVRCELYMKGIEEHIIEKKTAESFDREEDLARINEILAKRNHNRMHVDNPDRERLFQREAAFLKRRGFQDDLILTALKNFNISE